MHLPTTKPLDTEIKPLWGQDCCTHTHTHIHTNAYTKKSLLALSCSAVLLLYLILTRHVPYLFLLQCLQRQDGVVFNSNAQFEKYIECSPKSRNIQKSQARLWMNVITIEVKKKHTLIKSIMTVTLSFKSLSEISQLRHALMCVFLSKPPVLNVCMCKHMNHCMCTCKLRLHFVWLHSHRYKYVCLFCINKCVCVCVSVLPPMSSWVPGCVSVGGLCNSLFKGAGRGRDGGRKQTEGGSDWTILLFLPVA